MMNNIAEQAIVLKLNRSWMPVGVQIVQKTICDLVTGVIEALDISYAVDADGVPDTSQYEYVNPVTWDEWINLPIRSYDPVIHTAKMTIRIPTVVITKKYNKMPTKKYRGKPTKEALFYRDGGRDIYTGDIIKNLSEATIDHIHPRCRGGSDSYENTGLTIWETNNKKGDKTVDEAGLTLKIVPSTPKEVPIYKTIRSIRHPDWQHFINKN